MSLLNSVNNLTSAVADKISQVSTIAKIAGCLPSILTSLPSIAGGIAGNIVKSVVGGATSAVKTLLSSSGGFLSGIVNETVTKIKNAVLGLFNTVLNLQAQLVKSIERVKALKKFVEDEFKDIKEFIKNDENCKFAAAELVNCIAGNLLGQLASTFNSKTGGSLGFLDKIGSAVDRVTGAISAPGEALNGWVNNTASQIDRATSRIEATKLF